MWENLWDTQQFNDIRLTLPRFCKIKWVPSISGTSPFIVGSIDKLNLQNTEFASSTIEHQAISSKRQITSCFHRSWSNWRRIRGSLRWYTREFTQEEGSKIWPQIAERTILFQHYHDCLESDKFAKHGLSLKSIPSPILTLYQLCTIKWQPLEFLHWQWKPADRGPEFPSSSVLQSENSPLQLTSGLPLVRAPIQKIE